MPIMTNPKTGEKKEISMEEFMKMMQDGEFSVRQEVHHADGSVTSSMIYGNDLSDGIDRSVNIFGTMADVIKPALVRARKIKETSEDENNLFFMDNKDADYEVTIDDTESPLMHIVTITETNICVKRYIRDERKSVGEPISECTVSFDEGKYSAKLEDLQEENQILLFAFGVYELRRILEERGILQELIKLGNKSAGVVITSKDDEIIARIVRGRNRPDLPCLMFGGLFAGGLEDAVMMRPYMDEQIGEVRRSGMDLDDIISEAEGGDPDCMENLAQLYLNGDGVEQDFKKSAYWWEKLAKTDNAIAQFNIGLFYAKGCGVDRDFAKAAHWMKKAAENGDEDAIVSMEIYESAVDNLKRAMEGDPIAQAEIAKTFTQIGGSLEQYGPGDDFKAALMWAQKSANQGNLDGLYCLALCYEHGRGTAVDQTKAVTIYEKAALKGHAPSQWNLAVCYLMGQGIQQDEAKGLYWAYQAADQDYDLAINGLESQGKSVHQIIEKYQNPDYIVSLEGTQYEGRADRCERIHAGQELQYKIVKEKNGDDTIECFYAGETVGLISKWLVKDVITLLKMDRISLNVQVESCIPKSKRGSRARIAEVHLRLILKEKNTGVSGNLAECFLREKADNTEEVSSRRQTMKNQNSMFTNFENYFKSSTEENITKMALNSFDAIHGGLHFMEINAVFDLLTVSARLGISSNGILNNEEKNLTNKVFGEYWSRPIEELYEIVGKKIEDIDFEIITSVLNLRTFVNAHLLVFILSFAYIDGKINDEDMQKIENIFSKYLDDLENKGILWGGENVMSIFYPNSTDNINSEEDDVKERLEKEKKQKEDRMEEEFLERETREKAEEKMKQEDPATKYERDLQKYNEEVNRVKEEFEEKLEEGRESLNETLKHRKDEARIRYVERDNELNQEKEKRKKERKEAEELLNSLKLFEFGKKKEARSIIEKETLFINSLDEEMKREKQKYLEKLDKIEQEIEEEKINLEKKLKEIYREPERPKKPYSLMTKTEKENEKLKEEIIYALKDVDMPVTIEELMQVMSILRYPTYSTQQITYVMSGLIKEGKVERHIENRKRYYGLTE